MVLIVSGCSLFCFYIRLLIADWIFYVRAAFIFPK